MFWDYFGDVQWLVLVGFVAGGFGRALKRFWPTLPKTALPFGVLAFAYVVVFADLMAGYRQSDVAALWALSSLFSSSLAIAGHETLKKALGTLLGDNFAELVLGVLETKLPAIDLPKPAKPDTSK